MTFRYTWSYSTCRLWHIVMTSGVLALAILPGGCTTMGMASYAATHPPPKDIISRALREGGRWNQLSDLVPAPFAFGQSRAVVEAELIAAGYSRGKTDLRLTLEQQRRVSGSENWRLFYQGLPCDLDYDAFISFDDAGKLNFAVGVVHEVGCL